MEHISLELVMRFRNRPVEDNISDPKGSFGLCKTKLWIELYLRFDTFTYCCPASHFLIILSFCCTYYSLPLDPSHLQEWNVPSYLIWEWEIKTSFQLISYQFEMHQAPQIRWNSWKDSTLTQSLCFGLFVALHGLLYT